MKRRGCFALALAVAASALLVSRTGAASENKDIRVLKIGLVQSLFRNTAGEKVLAQAQPLGEIMAAQSGVRMQFCSVGDHEELAKRLQTGEIHLAVMHGVELGWVQKNAKDLQPLVLAMNQTIRLKSYVLVRQDDPAQSLADLKGRKLAMPARSLYHNYLFLQRALEAAGLNPAGFFEETNTLSVYAALDGVLDGQADVAVVDGVAWENFRENKTGRAKRLKVLTESTVFPTAALVYKPGIINERQEKQLRDSLTGLHQKPVGRQMLLLWRLTQFMDVPDEYQSLLDDVLKEYPQPPKPVEFCVTGK